MAKDKEEGVVLVKHTAEYQQKRKSRKKAAKQHKKVSAMPSVVKAKTHKKKTGGGKESKQKKLKHKHMKKTKEPSPSPAGEQPASAPKVKKVPHRSAKKKTTEMKEGAVRPAQLANRKSMEMVQGRKEMKEPRPWPGMRPRPSQTAVQPRKSQTAMPPSDEKQKESTPPTARDNSEQMVCRGLSRETGPGTRLTKILFQQVTAREPTREEAYLGRQLDTLVSRSNTPVVAAPPSAEAVPQGGCQEVVRPPPPPKAPASAVSLKTGRSPSANSSGPLLPPILASAPSQEMVRSSQLRVDPVQQQQQPQARQRPARIGINVDEVLRLGALMERCGSSETRKHSFEWLARNRVVLQGDPGRTSRHLMEAVGDVECDKLLAVNSFQELQKAGTLTAEEVARLISILDTIHRPLTVSHLAHLVHTEGAYYRNPPPPPSIATAVEQVNK